MTLSGDAVRRIREAFIEATATPSKMPPSRIGLGFRRTVSVTASPAPVHLHYAIYRRACRASGAISRSGPINARFTRINLTGPLPALVAALCGRAASACVRDPSDPAPALDRRPRRSPRRDHRGGLHCVHPQSANSGRLTRHPRAALRSRRSNPDLYPIPESVTLTLPSF